MKDRQEQSLYPWRWNGRNVGEVNGGGARARRGFVQPGDGLPRGSTRVKVVQSQVSCAHGDQS